MEIGAEDDLSKVADVLPALEDFSEDEACPYT